MDVENALPQTDEDAFNGFDEDEADDGMELDLDADEDDLPAFFKEETQLKLSKTNARKSRGKVHDLVREKIRRVLEDKSQLSDKRARMCEEGDFLKLLYLFNQEGIHFT